MFNTNLTSFKLTKSTASGSSDFSETDSSDEGFDPIRFHKGPVATILNINFDALQKKKKKITKKRSCKHLYKYKAHEKLSS